MAFGDQIRLTATYVAVTGTDSIILAANSRRRYLMIVSRDTLLVDIAFDRAALTGQDIPIAGAAALGGQGGAFEFSIPAACDPRAVHAVTASGTSHVTIIEGVNFGG